MIMVSSVQLQSGALYCQILDAYEGKVNLQKVNWKLTHRCFADVLHALSRLEPTSAVWQNR